MLAASRTCTICGKQSGGPGGEAAWGFRGALAALGYDGMHAHASCIRKARKKALLNPRPSLAAKPNT